MKISLDVINRFILEKQHLTENTRTNNVVLIMEDLLGLHATNNTSPYISLFVRGEDFTTKFLHEIFYDSKNIAKIRCIRGTVFFQYLSQIQIMHNATLKARLKNSKKRLEHFKISDEVLYDSKKKILALLKNNPLTTKEIRSELKPSYDLTSVLFYLSDKADIIRSKPRRTWIDRMHTYELMEEAVPSLRLDTLNEKDAINQLILSYISKYGPVCEEDIVWWTGLNKTPIRETLNEFKNRFAFLDISPLNQEYIINKQELEILKDLKPLHESVISILPCLDPYIMGYKIRDRYIEQFGREYIFDRSGNATNVIILNGKVAGIWDWESKEPILKYFIFGDLSIHQKNLLNTELENLGRFLYNTPFDILEKKEMEPLTKRTAGWVLKPLRD